ncbi:TPA: restriction endonuclease subunit S [Salmonella enterica subsp. salamae serovar 35:g,m,s,t:-]|nr:restriction endonuclease subunit S [Salmonella enterica]MBA3000056.1 restriction endonuclease subunit S [Salmonella enterica subsp. salamae serovar 3,10:b:e,n,x]HCA3406666.1 restriction endonuclease subunit S [Salmonella enterica subsp. salamae serovar 35:g,m,s,t:-]EBS6873092.1 restriction endonuclease subunit S [Salmonella enterica]HCA3418959.1 restriction endonuclease subunit S [Salmonella enterica subsp. salamae serovar 35:g,m,s,t:-]
MGFDFQLLENAGIQLIDGDRGKNYPKHNDFMENGYCLFLSAKNVTKSGFQFQETAFINETKDCELKAGKLKYGDIVLTTRGTVGNVAYYDSNNPYKHIRINSGMIIIRSDSKLWNPKFLYFILTSAFLQEQIVNLISGSAVPQLPARDIKKFILPVISKNIQDKISNVISALNDKISVNIDTNQTLEQMSQTIFKSWFVDFDPVIDNALDAGNSIPEALQSRAELRQKVRNSADFKPLPADIRALFPAEFEETELGLIPKNWHIRDFSDIAVLIKNNIKSDDICDDIHYIGLEHLERKHIFITSYGNGSDVSSNKSAFNKGDLLFGKLRPYFHKVAITPFSGICSTDILVFRAKEKFYKSLMAMYAFTDEFVAYANLRSTGTRMPRAEAKDLLKYKIILPNKDILEKFELLLEGYWTKGQLNNNENEQLTALRDTLLPKLISGELSLEDLPNLVDQTEPA